MQSQTFAADLDSLQPIREFVKSAADGAGLNERDSYNLQLAVDEIATNIILYGYQQAGLKGVVVISADQGPEVLRITVEDTSGEFDPRSRAVEEGDLTKPLEERAIGGLGIFLALKGVDRFFYERKDQKNYNIFEMDLKKNDA